VSWSSFTQAVCALRFLYRTTLGRPEQLPLIPFGKRPRKLPSVLSPDEVLRLLEAAPPPRDRVLLQVAYGCGLRLSELTHLQVTDIDSARMVLHVRQGKGRKDRLVPLPVRLLGELRAYWRGPRPPPRRVPPPPPGAADHRQQHPAPLRPPGPAGRPEQALLDAHAAAQLRHAPARSRRRSAHAQGAAGAHQPGDDRPLPARQHAAPAPGAQLARPARPAAAERGTGVAGGGLRMTATLLERPALEVADVIREYGEAFLDRYGGVLSPTQRR